MPKAGKPQELTGVVERELVRPGSAGEHEAVVLRLESGERVILQRRGGNPFDDAQTQRLAGHRVRVKGFRLESGVFRYVEAELADT